MSQVKQKAMAAKRQQGMQVGNPEARCEWYRELRRGARWLNLYGGSVAQMYCNHVEVRGGLNLSKPKTSSACVYLSAQRLLDATAVVGQEH